MKYIVHKFYRLSSVGDLKLLMMVYSAYAQSIFQYGIRVWGGALDTHFNKIGVIQRHILKAALQRPRRYPSHLLYEEFPVLTVRQLYIKNLILYINRSKNTFTPYFPAYNFRSPSNYRVSRTDLIVCRRQFPYVVNKLINLLPENLILDSITKSSTKK